MVRTVVEDDGARRPGELLDKLDALRIVLPLDLLVVRERGVRCGAAEELEAGGVERDGVLLPADVLDLHFVRDPLPVALRACGVGVDPDVRLLSVGGRRKVEECRRDGVGR